MTDVREFLAWFEGFSENIEEAPTTKQWERLKERVKKLQAPAVPSAAGLPPPGPMPPGGVPPAAPGQVVPMAEDVAKRLAELKKQGGQKPPPVAMSAGP